VARKRSTKPRAARTSNTDSQSSQSSQRQANQPKPLYKVVKPKTVGQATYCKALKENIVTFGIGPAGSGKTYLAVAAAVESLFKGEIKRIILVRPAVEAGERLGFLPGDMAEKINPYLRPLLDALNDIVDHVVIKNLMAQEIIEIAPLAFMRGRTLNDAAIILDEAQNATSSQLKMFLTRIGINSRVMVTGDPSQNDLPYNTPSGLNDALQRLYRIRGVSIIKLDKTDIVRHPIVQEIVEAYTD
jgi:phosphate starvation-inducible PhoH-like protein